jgi:3-oxoacyl-(acyl-carrier-protein) synthase/acyl carrier protein
VKDTFILGIRHPILSNHVVYGVHLLPGLAYIDLLYQLHREQGRSFRDQELVNLWINRPLTVDRNHDVLVEVEWSYDHDDGCSVLVYGTPMQQGGPVGRKEKYASAQLRRTTSPTFDETLNVREIRERSHTTIRLDKIYERCRARGLHHDNMMRAEGVAFATDDALYIDIGVAKCAGDSSALMFHPALIDGAAVSIGALLSLANDARQESVSLPLLYESFRAEAILNERALVRVRRDAVNRKGMLSYVTLEFFDSNGRKVAELTNLASKHVQEIGGSDHADKAPQQPFPTVRADHAPRRAAKLPETGLASVTALVSRVISKQIGRQLDETHAAASYDSLGLTSRALIDIVAELEAETGLRLAPTLMFEYSSIREIANHLYENQQTEMRQFCSEANTSVAPNVAPLEAAPSPVSSAEQRPKESAPVTRAVPEHRVDDIAVIGLAGRFPGARDIRAFWRRLRNSDDLVTDIPRERWSTDDFYDSNFETAASMGKSYSKWGAFLDGADEFDVEFFRACGYPEHHGGIQDRQFLEVVWSLLESGAYTRASLAAAHGDRVGVYVGAMATSYGSPTGGIAANICRFFDWRGPCVAIDTMSSSTMTALHLACEDLKRGNCEVAVAGGVCILTPQKYVVHSGMRTLSTDRDTRCFTNGNGLVLAECVSAVLLKPLSKAIEDHDAVLAVIKSTAAGHTGGRTGRNSVDPNICAKLLSDNLRRSGVHPRTISYVESAANGYMPHDQLEITALSKAFAEFTDDKQFCRIGTVKSNMGHAEAASAASQLAKLIMQLRHAELIPLLKGERLDVNMRLESTPFKFQRELERWERPTANLEGQNREHPRRALLTSFGSGGSFGSLIIEEYPQPPAGQFTGNPVLIVLSALSPNRLRAMGEQLLQDLAGNSSVSLRDLAFTLQTGREELPIRVGIVAVSVAELLKGLDAFVSAEGAVESLPVNVFLADDTVPTNLYGSERRSDAVIVAPPESPSTDDLASLARHWVRGGQVEWSRLHDTNDHKLTLPTYPFARTRPFAVRSDLSKVAVVKESIVAA